MGLWRKRGGGAAGETEELIAELIHIDQLSLPDRGEFAVRKFMRIIGGAERLTIPLEGRAKEAHSRLVNIGSRALPALREKNERLIAEHQAYREWLRTGPSSNPLENYSLRSDAEKQYRHVIEMQQARILDVIKEIEAAVR